MSVISFLTLIFQYINVLFPDPLEYVDPFSGAIRFSMAALIIVFPLYVFLTRKVNEDIRHNQEKKELGIRKWLIYLTLFIAGATIVVDLIVLINSFLQGDLTVRFLLKVLSVLVVASAVFGYYISDLRGRWEENEKGSKTIAWISGVVVLVSVIAGFFIIGSPFEARENRFDRQKVQDLQSIQWQVVNYWQRTETLPETLDDLKEPLSGFMVPVDPQTGEPYTYRVLGDRSFELCATFNNSDETDAPIAPFRYGYEFGGNWEHGEGEECFERTIDPELYPPYEKPRLAP